MPTAVSSDFVHWRRVADSLPDLPSWAVPSRTMTWGPTARRVGDQWVLYYSTQEAASQRECIGRATSASPTGAFTDGSSAPLVCQATLGGDIDPSVVTDASGTSSLLWKNDGNATGATVSIWEQPLADARRMPTTANSASRATMLTGAPWEEAVAVRRPD